MISIRRIIRALNIPVDEWQFMPDAICYGMLRKKLVSGELVYGVFNTKLCDDDVWRKNNSLYGVDGFHCWIKSDHDEIIDPTLFTFIGTEPKIDIKYPYLLDQDHAFYYTNYVRDKNVNPLNTNNRIVKIPGRFNIRRKPIRLYIEDISAIGFLQSISPFNGKSIDLSNLFYLCQMPIEILNCYVLQIYDAVIRAGYNYMISNRNLRMYKKISDTKNETENGCVS